MGRGQMSAAEGMLGVLLPRCRPWSCVGRRERGAVVETPLKLSTFRLGSWEMAPK